MVSGGMGSIPGWGAGIPHVSWPKDQKTWSRRVIMVDSMKDKSVSHSVVSDSL